MNSTNRLRYLISLLSLSLICLLGSACSDGNGNTTPATPISVSTDSFDFGAEGGESTLTFSSPGEWDAVPSESWIKLIKSDQLKHEGKIIVKVEANNSRDPRSGEITIVSGAVSAKVVVSQAGMAATPVDPTISVPEGYELIWNDEFDGTSLNRADWTHEVKGPGWVNNELQHYVDATYGGKPVTEVSEGSLKINCFKASDGKICSGRIYAKVNTGWKYGIFEAAIKLPKGKGTWPAFWMMPVNNDFNANPWPKCGEIDIMEEVGYHPEYTSSSIHCESYNHVKGTQKTAERLTEGAQSDFHVYRLEWTQDYIRTSIDGKTLLNFSNDGKGNVSTWPFNRHFYIILNLAWGGTWGGAQGVDETVLPATMEVDYVRVFQKK